MILNNFQNNFKIFIFGIDDVPLPYIMVEKKANLWPIPLFHARKPKVCIQG